MDDIIYQKFREEFPDLDVTNIKEDDLKSSEAKQVCLVLKTILLSRHHGFNLSVILNLFDKKAFQIVLKL